MIGTTLGPYQVTAKIGEGEVYKATDTRLDRTVAIKVLPEHVAADPDLKQRFEREAKTVAGLSHPHICPVFDVGSQDGIDYLVMEYLDGETLAQRLENGALPLDQALQIAIEIADGLDTAHRQGITHRDLKPGNIMLTKAGAKLLDFGLAKLKPPEQAGGPSDLPTQPADLTQKGTILGTFQYMAPEQLECQAADHRTDIFALGAVVYEMITGRKAFEGKSQASLIAAILEREPPAMSELQPMSPPLLDAVVRTCLAKDTERRWQSAHDLALVLHWPTSQAGGETDRSGGGPVERHFVLTASHVRQLTERNPRLVGYPMTYIDNRVESEQLVVFLHGIAADAGRVEDAVRASPHRAVAITLVGFGGGEKQRPSLSMDDHSRVLRWVLREQVAEIGPKRTLLVGLSAGADQFLRMIHDDAAAGVNVAGLLAMGANVSIETCFASRVCAGIDIEDPSGTLASLKALSSGIDSLDHWVAVQSYLTQMLLNTDQEVLKRYTQDLVAPFEQPGDPLADWYRAARRRIPRVRLVFSNEETEAAEALLARHLDSNVLGDGFTEDSFVIEPAPHLSLFDTELVSRHVNDMLE